MSQRVKTNARALVLTRSSQPENGLLRKKVHCFPGYIRIIQAKTYTPFQTVVTKRIPQMPDR
jgi:hypothetical protein